MLAEIITVGDELLIGQVVDTNSAWIAGQLNERGVKVFQITSVSDEAGHIMRAIEESMRRAELVIVTGGLGPTKDDITKHTLARMFGMAMTRNEQVFEQVRKMVELRGIVFNELNQGQALVPDGCTVLSNLNGTAPGMWFEREGRVLVALPGVPFEMKELITSEVLPRVSAYFNLKSVIHKTAITFGLAESILAETIEEWEDALPSYLHLAYLPNAANIRLRLSAYEVDVKKVGKEIDRRFGLLEKIIPRYMLGYGDTTLESATGELLQTQGGTVAVAESCTGGNIAHRFTSIAGASAYFKGGVVAYSNEVKMALLGVDPQTLNQFGAVSRQVAEQMAVGVCRATGADYGISTTGIAGPGGGTPEKPVGMVWMAVATPQGVFSREMVFGSLRAQNIERASSHAINLLRLYLSGGEDVKLTGGVL